MHLHKHTHTHTHTHLSLNLKREEGVLKGGNGHLLIHSKQCPPGTPAWLEQGVFFRACQTKKFFKDFMTEGMCVRMLDV